jgi:hypothetical protein
MAACSGNPRTDSAQQHPHDDSADLDAQIATVRAATERYRDFTNAQRDGYKLFGKEGPLMGEHWYRADLVKQPLDLARPSTLQYATINGKRELIGVAYTTYNRPGEALPEGFVGSADHWHVHDVDKIARVITADRPFLRWVVNRRIAHGKTGAGDGRTHLTMLHAWIWSDNPEGMFALEHRALPYLRAGFSADLARAGDAYAAYGVALLDRRGCEWELGRIKLLAKPSRQQLRTLTNACNAAAAKVKGSDAARLNDVASKAWQSYLATRAATLSLEQTARLDAMVEHKQAQHHH